MSVLTLVKQCFQIVGMFMTVWVVTWFEIVQGFMTNANTAFLFTSVGFGAMTVQVIKYVAFKPPYQQSHHLSPSNATHRRPRGT